MAERFRVDLRNEFRDGERPTGADFADLIDSFLCKKDDLVTIDANANLDLPAGINLKDVVTGVNGTLRFNGGQVQVFDGAVWNNISGGGGGGAFTPVGGGPHVAFDGGNVGIGTFAVPPTFRLEVPLGNNTGPDQRVRLGNAAVANGVGASQTAAQFSHQAHSDNTNFALRQGQAGEVNLNAPNGQPLTISHNRTQARVFIAADGTVVIANNAIIPQLNVPNVTVFQVNGFAGKTQGGASWAVPSDLRLKENIEPFADGLAKLMDVKPVRFHYKDQPGAQEEVGVIGQEIEKVFPYMISKTSPYADTDDDGMLMYNSNALTYVMVNAIQELATRLVQLEQHMQTNNAKS